MHGIFSAIAEPLVLLVLLAVLGALSTAISDLYFPLLYKIKKKQKKIKKNNGLQCFDAVGWAAGRASGL